MIIIKSIFLIFSFIVVGSSLYIISYGVNSGLFDIDSQENYIHPRASTNCLIAASAALIIGLIIFFIFLSLLVG